jgi:hypothetical protein
MYVKRNIETRSRKRVVEEQYLYHILFVSLVLVIHNEKNMRRITQPYVVCVCVCVCVCGVCVCVCVCVCVVGVCASAIIFNIMSQTHYFL